MKKSEYYYRKADIIREKIDKTEKLNGEMSAINKKFNAIAEEAEKELSLPIDVERMRVMVSCLKNECSKINAKKDVVEMSAKAQELELEAKWNEEMNN